jgi:hypothetical protein
MQKDNQKAVDRRLPFCIVCQSPSDYLFAMSVHRLLITRQCKEVIRRRWTDIAKRQSEGGGQTMQKGN